MQGANIAIAMLVILGALLTVLGSSAGQRPDHRHGPIAIAWPACWA